MISGPLFQIENQFRRAVESSSYADAQRLVVTYCRAAAAEIRQLPTGDSNAGEIAARVNQTLDWGRNMLFASRAAHVESLRIVPSLKQYLQSNVQRTISTGVDV